MMKFLRSQSQTVLVIVLGVIGLGFLFYGSAGNLLTTGTGHISNDFGRIDGEDLSVADLYDSVRETRNALIIQGHEDYLTQPNAHAQIAQEAWGRLLLLHEADRLHVQVSDQEVIDLIHKEPLFQKDGVYSPEVYQSRMADLHYRLRIPTDPGIDPVASTKTAFANILRDNLRINAVKSALFSSVRTSAQDVSEQYEKFYGLSTVSVITFDPKTFVDAAQVKPEDIEAEYKSHPENPGYRTKEKRKVDYVLFLLSPDQAKLKDKEKAAAKDALGEKALDFALAFQPDPSANTAAGTPPPAPAIDFIAEAKKRGLSPATTDFFTADTTPANVPPSPAFNNAAFGLTKEDATSRVVELDNGVAVLHLAEIQPSDLRPLAEVKADIEKKLKQDKGSEAAEVAAYNASQALQAAVAKGTDFKAAAAALNLKVETIPAFVPTKTAPTDQRLQTIAYAVTGLTAGQVSKPVPIETDNSSLVLHLDSRAKPDPAGQADFDTRFGSSQNDRLRQLVYEDWINWQNKQRGTHQPPSLEAYGSID